MWINDYQKRTEIITWMDTAERLGQGPPTWMRHSAKQKFQTTI